MGLKAVRRLVPRGTHLPEDAWQRRHAGLVALLWLHVPAVVAFGVAQGSALGHAVVEGVPLATLAALATFLRLGRRLRMASATVGLMMSSAIVVHLSEGSGESHFHFFVMVAVVSLYQSWSPFLLAVGFVVAHHGIVGVLDPPAVFNHPAALEHPWRWAVLHGAFILGESVALLTTWRVSEAEQDETARIALELQRKELAQRQALEINDTVVQGLTVASYALDLGDNDLAAAALQETLAAARTLVSRLLDDTSGGNPLQAGDLVREAAAVVVAERHPAPLTAP